MNDPLHVVAHERGIVRVFALSMTAEQAKALREDLFEDEDAPAPLTKMLGATYLDSDFTEIFPVSDLGDLGLVGYLIDGNGIDPAAIAPDRTRLAALEGWVLLVYSNAFDGIAQTLTPAPELTLIGTYAEPGVDWSDGQTLRSESAKPQGTTSRKPVSDAAMSGRIAMAALLVITALTALMVWIAA